MPDRRCNSTLVNADRSLSPQQAFSSKTPFCALLHIEAAPNVSDITLPVSLQSLSGYAFKEESL